MATVYPSAVNLNGNVMAAVDLETTGLRAGYHEPVQIAVQPLDSDFNPLNGVRPFYWNMKPSHPERANKRSMAVHGISLKDLLINEPEPDTVQDLLVEWWEDLNLQLGKKLVPLAHNWVFESAFLKAWLSVELTEHLFHFHPRDAMLLALAINDRASMLGREFPFNQVGLSALCQKLGIVNKQPHDALCDATAEAQVYRSLLLFEVF